MVGHRLTLLEVERALSAPPGRQRSNCWRPPNFYFTREKGAICDHDIFSSSTQNQSIPHIDSTTASFGSVRN